MKRAKIKQKIKKLKRITKKIVKNKSIDPNREKESKKVDLQKFYASKKYRWSLHYSDFKPCALDFFGNIVNQNANRYDAIRNDVAERHYQQLIKYVARFLKKNRWGINKKNDQGKTLLMELLDNKQESNEEKNSLSDIVNQHFSDVFSPNEKCFYTAKALIEYKANLNITDRECHTLLEKALPENSRSFTRCDATIWMLLITARADINLANSNGRTALHSVCANPALGKRAKTIVIKKFLEEGALAHIKDNDNKYPRKLLLDNEIECRDILFWTERREVKVIKGLKIILAAHLALPVDLTQLILSYFSVFASLKSFSNTSASQQISRCGSSFFPPPLQQQPNSALVLQNESYRCGS